LIINGLLLVVSRKRLNMSGSIAKNRFKIYENTISNVYDVIKKANHF